MRPERMQKLKVAGNSGQNPGFDFLQECWNDDPAKADCDQKTIGEVSAMGNCLRGWGVGGLGRVASAVV
ncbi:hypothetical protein [Nostoc sp. FACHB-888]|uniref:hypothetical protein n=1 Tax=Nostoc sp. FACHB-888 TaxID=2692842 RepID=UPI001F55214C|nr:hypothetical protein [Nostoc sp. FACHB-888]